MEDDRARWNEKHAAEDSTEEPAGLLKMIFEEGSWPIAPGRALDIAAGKGRNALFLAARGFEVEAVDISEVALEEARRRAEARSLAIRCVREDLETARLSDGAYDLILNFNFLQRSLVPEMKKALRLGGHIVFETYLTDQRVFGHPRSPAYLLGHNELLELFRGFRVLYYREGKSVERGRAAYRASLLAQKV